MELDIENINMETKLKEKVKLDRGTRRIYKTTGGLKVPGVTTVLGILNKPALLDWAAKEERKGVMECLLNKKILPEKHFYTTLRDTAASIGTICHFMCECHLKGLEADLSEFEPSQVSQAENGYIKFLDFWDKSGFNVLTTEQALVHEGLGFGGTIDIVCNDKDGRLVLLDLKTSKAIYPEYWSQVAAYREMWDFNNQNKIARNIIIRIGKDEANDLEVIENNELASHYKLFLGALMCYKAQKEIKQ